MSQTTDMVRKALFLPAKKKAGKREPLKSSVIKPAATKGFSGWVNRQFFGWKTREAVYENLATKLMNNQTDIAALERYRDMMLSRNRKTRAAIINDILRRARQSGTGLSVAFAPWIPKEEQKILEGGQRAGNIPKALETIIQLNEQKAEMQSKLKSAVSQPAFYVLVIYAFLLFIGIYITPEFSKFLPNPTGIASLLYAEGRFVDSWQAFIPPVIALTLTGLFIWSLPRWTGPYRAKLDQHLPYSFFKETRGYIWLTSFVAMLESGIPDVEIIRQQIKDADPWMKERLRYVINELGSEGVTLPVALRNASVRRVKFEFPNSDLIDDIDGSYGYEDSSERIQKIMRRWSYRFDKKMSKRIKMFGYSTQMAVYFIMGFLLIALNALTIQLSSGNFLH